ncbi:hypothetical protein GGI24_001708 [Coemansia furcata]|nr:hypothetical protein GGI24_001708 [Coemansia furcata]
MAEFAANPSDKVLPANPSSEAIEALYAAVPANFDDILAALHLSNVASIAPNIAKKVAMHGVQIETENRNVDLGAARRVAKEVAEHGVHVAECVAINAIDVKAAIKAAEAAEALRVTPKAIQPSEKAVKRVEVNAIRIARERAVIADIQKSVCE